MDVSVVQLDGTRHRLRLQPGALVSEVKRRLEAACRIPRETQRLLREGAVLEAGEALAPAEGGAELELQLVKVPAPVLCVLGGIAASASAERFEPETGTWQPLPSLRRARAQSTAVAHDGMLYVLGGTDGTRPLALVERLNVASGDAWEPMPPLQTARERCSATVLGGMLHAIGGADELQPLASVERLDARAGGAWRAAWEEGPQLCVARRDCNVAELNGAIYAVAGAWGQGARVTECLDGGADFWQRLADMNEARTRCLLLAAAGRLFAVGGFDGYHCIASVESFRPEEGKWERLADLREARLGAAAVAHGGAIYIAGGSTGYRCVDTAERYDPALDSWERLPSMTQARYGCTAATLGGHCYVLGGTEGGREASARAERLDLEQQAAPLQLGPAAGAAEEADTASLGPEKASGDLAWELLPPLAEVKFACSAVLV